MTKKLQQILAFGFGVAFVIALLVLAVAIPSPTAFQYTVFRVVLALAAAGVAAMIPGFLQITLSEWIRAGGALGVFVVVYFYNPASLVVPPPEPTVTIKPPSVIDLRTSKSPHQTDEERLNAEAVLVVPFLYENTRQPAKSAKIKKETASFKLDEREYSFTWRFYANQHQENIGKWLGIEGDVYPKTIMAGETEYHETIFKENQATTWGDLINQLIDSKLSRLSITIKSEVADQTLTVECNADLDFLRASIDKEPIMRATLPCI